MAYWKQCFLYEVYCSPKQKRKDKARFHVFIFNFNLMYLQLPSSLGFLFGVTMSFCSSFFRFCFFFGISSSTFSSSSSSDSSSLDSLNDSNKTKLHFCSLLILLKHLEKVLKMPVSQWKTEINLKWKLPMGIMTNRITNTNNILSTLVSQSQHCFYGPFDSAMLSCKTCLKSLLS